MGEARSQWGVVGEGISRSPPGFWGEPRDLPIFGLRPGWTERGGSSPAISPEKSSDAPGGPGFVDLVSRSGGG